MGRKSKRWQRESMVSGIFLRVRGGQHEDHVRRRLLQRLEEGVEGRAREHVDLVDDVDLEAPRAGEYFTFSRSVRISSTPLLLAASISSMSTGAPETKSQAGRASRRRPRAAGARGAGQRLGQQPRGGGLADAARAGEEVGVGDAPARSALRSVRVTASWPTTRRRPAAATSGPRYLVPLTTATEDRAPPIEPSVPRSPDGTCSGQVLPRHSGGMPYRCSLPGLAGFAHSRRVGPSPQRRPIRLIRHERTLKGEFNPAIADCGLQGTATSPSSTAQVSKNGGGGGIRTHGTVARTRHFQCRTFGHSATPPHYPAPRRLAHEFGGGERI